MENRNLKMQDGYEMPIMGFGTWDLRGASGQEAIEYALSIGYRHIDTADMYRNHEPVGNAMRAYGKRDDLYLVTKLYPPNLGRDVVLRATYRFLDELKTDYIDMLLIHWPASTPVAETLGAMQRLQSDGVVRSIGISNFEGYELDEVLALDFPVVNNQIEIHTKHYPQAAIQTCQENGIVVTSYSPLGEGGLVRNAELKRLADADGITVAQLLLAYLMTKDLVVIPRSGNKAHIKDNWESLGVTLSDNAIRALDGICMA